MYSGIATPPAFTDERSLFHSEERKALLSGMKANKTPPAADHFSDEKLIVCALLMFFLSDKTKTDLYTVAALIYLLI